MNCWQVAKQLRFLLRAATWSDSPSNKVFGQVLVSQGPSDRAVGQLRFPFALVIPLDASADEEEPTLEDQSFEVRIVNRVANDPWGESALIGGPRSSQGSSAGRGLMELEEALMDTVSSLDRTNGIRLRLDYRTAVAAQVSEDFGYVALRAFRFRALLSASRSYEACSRFTAVDATSGSGNLAWTLPPTRYDTLALVLRRASGATAPTSVTGGDGVTVGASATSLTDTPAGGAGVYSYSLWRSYDETGGGNAERYSAAVSATVTIS